MKLLIEVNEVGQVFRVGREFHTVIGFAYQDSRDYMYTTYLDDEELIFPCRWVEVDGEWYLYDTSDITILDIMFRFFDGEK